MNYAAIPYAMEERAFALRALLGLTNTPYLDVVDTLKRLRSSGVIFGWSVVSDDSLPLAEALWNPVRKSITFRKSVYDGAQIDDKRMRFTVAHEIGHAFLRHMFKRNRRTIKQGREYGALLSYQETEANRFAAAFLAPAHLVEALKITSARQLAMTFGLSQPSAEIRWTEIKSLGPLRIGNSIGRPPDLPEGEEDTYEVYMRAVLKQAVVYPDR